MTLNGGKCTNYEHLIDGDMEARPIALSCSEPPRWTLQMLADKAVEPSYVPAISTETVRKTLKKASDGQAGTPG